MCEIFTYIATYINACMLYSDFGIHPLFTLLNTITLPWVNNKPHLYTNQTKGKILKIFIN